MQSYSLLNAATIFLWAFMIVKKSLLVVQIQVHGILMMEEVLPSVRMRYSTMQRKVFCNKKLMATIILWQKRLILSAKDVSLTIYLKWSYFINRYYIALDNRFLNVIEETRKIIITFLDSIYIFRLDKLFIFQGNVMYCGTLIQINNILSKDLNIRVILCYA